MYNICKKCTALLALAIIIISWHTGCNTINPAEKVPTYIHIDSFSFETKDLHDIRYAWVYYNNNPVGAFDLPATVPIITSGTGEVKVLPGIPINGRAERPLAYPFYKGYSYTLAESPGKTVKISPVTGYFDSVKKTIISEFESGITRFAKWGGTATIVSASDPALILDGNGSGMVTLPSPADSSIDSTRNSFKVGYSAAFIEFDYKSSVNCVLGMTATLGSVITTDIEYLGGVLPGDDKWQKFYLNITSFVNRYQGGDYYLFIKTTVPNGQTGGRLLIDNIKLVTF